MISAREAIELLREGNLRFVSNSGRDDSVSNQNRISELASGQQPFAVVIGCSDSRVPPEIVFSLGLGDLFVIRVAGNIVTPTQIGSVEFAVMEFGTPLVVVLGHSRCGAVLAALESLREKEEIESSHLRSIVDPIRPSIESLMKAGLGKDTEALVERTVRANIDRSVNQLQSDSVVLKGMIREGELFVVGAEYSLETGIVEFYENEEYR